MPTFPRNPLQIWITRLLVWSLAVALTLSVLSITGCSAQPVVIQRTLPAAPVLCLEQMEGDAQGRLIDRDLPQPPEHPVCIGEDFNGCLEEKARDHLNAWNRAEETYDLERQRRWACVRYVREISTDPGTASTR